MKFGGEEESKEEASDLKPKFGLHGFFVFDWICRGSERELQCFPWQSRSKSVIMILVLDTSQILIQLVNSSDWRDKHKTWGNGKRFHPNTATMLGLEVIMKYEDMCLESSKKFSLVFDKVKKLQRDCLRNPVNH